MTRLIDADALKKAMDGYWGRCQRIRKPRNGETAVFLDVMATVENQPTVDAVPVIRCIDCKFHYNRTQCKKRIGAWFDDDYCNGAVRAERKEE